MASQSVRDVVDALALVRTRGEQYRQIVADGADAVVAARYRRATASAASLLAEALSVLLVRQESPRRGKVKEADEDAA